MVGSFYVHMCIRGGYVHTRGLGGVVVIDAAIGAHGRGSRPVHYLIIIIIIFVFQISGCQTAP